MKASLKHNLINYSKCLKKKFSSISQVLGSSALEQKKHFEAILPRPGLEEFLIIIIVHVPTINFSTLVPTFRNKTKHGRDCFDNKFTERWQKPLMALKIHKNP